MRLLHLSHNDIRNDTRTIKQILSAKEAGYDIFAVGLKLDKGISYSKLLNETEVVSHDLLSSKLSLLGSVVRRTLSLIELSIKFLLSGAAFKPDLIHCSDVVSLPAAVLVKFFSGGRLIYDAHELESLKNGTSRMLSFCIKLIEKICWPMVDGFITVSPSILEWYQNEFSHRSGSVVLNSPARDALEGSVRSTYFRKKFSIPDDEKIFLYVGIIGNGRGVEIMLEAFSSFVQSSHLIFLGYGPLEGAVKKAAASYANIHFHSGVEQEKMLELIVSADYGFCLIEPVSLSDVYSLPNKLFEYALSKVPVIASDLPEIKNYVEKYALGKITAPSAQAIAKIVKDIESGTPKAIHQPSENISDLTWQAQASEMLSLYNSVLDVNK